LVLAAIGCIVIPSEHIINAHIVVDVNIVQKQIGEINDYIAGETTAFPELTTPPKGKSEGRLRKTLEWLSPIQPVYAQESGTVSGEFRQATERRRVRKSQLDALKQTGCVGESNRGYVELRSSDTLDTADAKNQAQRLVADENEDRKAMYKELAKINKKSVTTIEQLSANDLLKRARPGELFQLPPEGAQFDEFKSSEAGKKLGAACIPGAWVTVK
jgi:uncharacterized protein YdbL (DUF1318 family)